jgi:hypothetical protein
MLTLKLKQTRQRSDFLRLLWLLLLPMTVNAGVLLLLGASMLLLLLLLLLLLCAPSL